MNNDDIKRIIESRAYSRIAPLLGHPKLQNGSLFWIAGGCLIRDGNDVDLFSASPWEINWSDTKTISTTRNAVTVEIGGSVFQFCDYRKPTLRELIHAFDFAHCQIGCVAEVSGGHIAISGVEWTDAFVQSRICGTTWYTGSEYPLSSLIRIHKYFKSGLMTRGAAIKATIDTLVGVIDRGFIDYDDFKDQLDAIDLGLVPEDMKDIDRESLMRLFTLLNG